MKRAELGLTLALANEFKEGDLLIGGTRDERVRSEARADLAGARLDEFDPTALIADGVSEALARSQTAGLAAEISRLTVGDLKRILLSPQGPSWAARYRDGLPSEAIAAVVKIMTDEELAAVARSLAVPLPGRTLAIGEPGHFGSRIQPNSPGDDEEEILFSVLEGLSYGCGDVILGINPASDDLETIVRLEELLEKIVTRLALPTRYSVLSDIIKQTRARSRTRVDVGFQSLAGTSRALSGMVGLEVDQLVDLAAGFDGLYFETGQGSEVTNGAAEGVDMVTLEARTYGVARHARREIEAARGAPVWMIVNDVAGFIGPEVFRTGAQLRRACLEDLVMARLHGLTMGLDICATFHMGIEPAELARLTSVIVGEAAPTYLMAVAGNADPMLGYLTTSFREHPRLRARYGRRASTAMAERLASLGACSQQEAADEDASVKGGERRNGSGQRERVARLYAKYMRAGGERRSRLELEAEARRKLERLQERGWDLGYGAEADGSAPAEVETRLATIYEHARRALYAALDGSLVGALLPGPLRVRSEARTREEYLSHPASGERICAADAARVRALYPVNRPAAQLVVSDGLNANAVNGNLRSLWPPLARHLASRGVHLGERAIVIENGRVRAGYHVGELLGVDLVLHLIGERPGTGIDTLSAYLTYGRDERGARRWSVNLDHAATTAICGIHRRGKDPEAAAEMIAGLVVRMLEERRSGVALGEKTL